MPHEQETDQHSMAQQITSRTADYK